MTTIPCFIPPYRQDGRPEKPGSVSCSDLPCFPENLVGVSNSLFKRRPPFEAVCAGRSVSVRMTADRGRSREGGAWFMLQGTEPLARLRMSQAFLQDLLGSLLNSSQHLPPAKTLSMLIELALVELIEALERRVTQDLVIEEASREPLPIRAIMQVSFPTGTHDVPIELSAVAAQLLAEEGGAHGRADSAYDLHCPVSQVIGASELTRGELASLRPGDIVVVQDSAEMPGVAVFGGHLVARLKKRGDLLILASVPRPADGTECRWTTTGRSKGHEPVSADKTTSIDDIPVRLHFELGRQEMSFRSIGELAEGSIIAAAPRIDDAVDIVANGRIVGRGTVTRLGEGVGVVVTRMFRDE